MRPLLVNGLTCRLGLLAALWVLARPAACAAEPIKIEAVWSTSHDRGLFVKDVTSSYGAAALTFTDGSTGPGGAAANIFPQSNQRLQPFDGWGAGITDSSSVVLQNLKASNASAYDYLMKMLFDPSKEYIAKGGAGLNLVRTPLSSTDFSQAEYTYDDTYDGSPDPELANFNINKAPKTWAMLKDVAKYSNGTVRHSFAPWSQPAWMKENQTDGSPTSLHGGMIKPEYYPVYATYLVKTLKALRDMGIECYRLSLQNEPLYGPAKYPGTLMPALEQAKIGDLTRKALDDAGFKDVGILALDHNWDNQIYPIDVFDNSNSFVGVAWHCYGGDPSGQQPFNLAYPDAEVHFTECTRITQFFNEPWNNLKTQGQTLINNTIAYKAQSVVLWNIALAVDDDGFTTPTLPNVCKNCLAPVLIGKDGSIRFTSDFATLAHGSLATRLRGNETQAYKMGVKNLEDSMVVQAFESPLGNGMSRFSLVILQQNDYWGTGRFEALNATISFRNQVVSLNLPVGMHTLWWHAATSPTPFSAGSAPGGVQHGVMQPKTATQSAPLNAGSVSKAQGGGSEGNQQVFETANEHTPDGYYFAVKNLYRLGGSGITEERPTGQLQSQGEARVARKAKAGGKAAAAGNAAGGKGTSDGGSTSNDDGAISGDGGAAHGKALSDEPPSSKHKGSHVARDLHHPQHGHAGFVRRVQKQVF